MSYIIYKYKLYINDYISFIYIFNIYIKDNDGDTYRERYTH